MKILIKNCNIINIENGDFIDDSAILIEGNIIVAIDNEKNLKIPQGTKILDVNGGWVLPGLSDVHVHICHEGIPELAKSFSYTEPVIHSILRAAKNLSIALSAGITTVRDMGTYKARNIQIKKAIEKEIFIGPRIVACGHLITSPKGHVHEIGKEVQGIENICRTVREELIHGADFIKVTNDPIGYSLDELKTIVDEAHKLGKKVACHAFTKESVGLALNAKVDTIEHGVPFDNRMIRQIIKQKTIIVPTYFCAVQTCKDISESLIKKGDLPMFEKWLDSLKQNLPKAIKNKIRIAAGTDAGYPPLRFNDVINEVISFVELGADPLMALQSTTKIAMEALGLEKYLGSIEKGKLADIVVVPQNPLEDITTLRNVLVVIKNGRIIKK